MPVDQRTSPTTGDNPSGFYSAMSGDKSTPIHPPSNILTRGSSTPKAPHPSSFLVRGKKYDKAVHAFFEVIVDHTSSGSIDSGVEVDHKKHRFEYSTTKLSYSSYLEGRRQQRKSSFDAMPKTTDENKYYNDRWDRRNMRREILWNYIDPTVASTKQDVSKVKIKELRGSYSALCDAVAEFELRASTLSSNSKALTLCKKLVTKDATNIFNILDHFPTTPRENAAKHHDIWEFKASCMDLLKELDTIDGSQASLDLNIFKRSQSAHLQHGALLSQYISNAYAALCYAEKDQFTYHCDLIFVLIRTTLQSGAMRYGLDSLIKKQDHFRNSFMDFATVAIFFSSITATTLQFSFQSGDSTIPSTIVNLCWFTSLVLSIASATNSLLGVLIHQSPEYIRPSQNLDFRFLQGWFKYIPPSLLTFSGVLFLVGFCAFTYLSSNSFNDQGTAIQSVTTSFTSTNILALLLISIFAFTRIIHGVAKPVGTMFYVTYHLAIVAPLLLLASLALPFMTIYSLLRHGKLPSNYKRILFWNEDFGKPGERLYSLYADHWEEIRECFHLGPGGLRKITVKKIGDLWKGLKGFFFKSEVPVASVPLKTSNALVG